jgi:hypothetical protein
MTEPELRVNRCRECGKITLRPLRVVAITEIENLIGDGTHTPYYHTVSVGVCNECFGRYNLQLER